MTEETLPDTSQQDDRSQTRPPGALAIVLAWSADEPERAGEVAVLPPSAAAEPLVWGRKGGANSPRRLTLHRQRPGQILATGEIDSPRVSRDQLHLRPRSDQCVEVTNAGRAPVAHNGDPKTSFLAVPGDVIEVGRHIVLLCVQRPAWLPGPRLQDDFPFGGADARGIVGESPAIWELRRQLAFLAPRRGHVLVRGASGTGKELVAAALHACSPRASRPMVARNAATLPEGIFDAELFGNLKNYPNPGMPERAGLVGEAAGSTLFLDEIGEVPEAAQARLLRLMDAGDYHRLGEARARRSDIRLIGATNRPDAALKHDLLARFELRVDLPSLAQRREDIPLLAVHVLRRIAAQDASIPARFFAEDVPRLTPGLVRLLLRHPFSTNVRELTAILWRALAESTGDRVDAPSGLDRPLVDAKNTVSGSGSDRPADPPGAASSDGLSPAAIQACLDAHNGVIEDAWQPLGLSSRHALARLIKKHGLELRRKRRQTP